MNLNLKQLKKIYDTKLNYELLLLIFQEEILKNFENEHAELQ